MARSHGRFLDENSTFKRKKLHRTNQHPNFIEGSFRNRGNEGFQTNLEEKDNPITLIDDLLYRTDPFIFK